jgi:hypothetical protein
LICPSCGGTGEDGAFHPCLQCHGDGLIPNPERESEEHDARLEISRLLEQARLALVASDDPGLLRALDRLQAMGHRLHRAMGDGSHSGGVRRDS